MTRRLLQAAALLCAVAATAQQQATPRATRQIVFGVAPFDGGRYLSAFVPEQQRTVYLTDSGESVLTVNMTDVYYWPIAAEYRADFQGVNVPLPGELAVYRGKEVVATLEQREYIYVYPLGLEGEATRLALGDEMRRFIADREQAGADYRAGKSREPPRSAYQGPFRGFVFRLEPGRYRLEYRIENQGRAFTLAKTLVVFQPLRRGVRYEIIPQEKWTVSSDSDSPHKRIYLKAGEVVYLKTFPSLLYNAAQYDLMAFPNRPTAGLGLGGTALWVRSEESLEDKSGAVLEIRAAGRSTAAPPRDYLVRQVPGSALGYDIVQHSNEASPGVRPSFRAYRIVAPPSRFEVRLRLPGIADSSRALRTVEPAGGALTALALLLPLVPLALRLALRASARRAWKRARFTR